MNPDTIIVNGKEYTGKGLGFDMEGRVTEISLWFGEEQPRYEVIVPVSGQDLYVRKWG